MAELLVICAGMRAAAIFGPGCSIEDLKPFQKGSDATWLVGLPAYSNEADAILVFGGDGTVHRHLPQLSSCGFPSWSCPVAAETISRARWA
jgi:NAD kinase